MKGKKCLAATAPQCTLVTLVNELARRAGDGETQEALLEWLYSITRSFGVRMRCVAAAHESGEAPLSAKKQILGGSSYLTTAAKSTAARLCVPRAMALSSTRACGGT